MRYPKMIPVRMDQKMYNELRKLSFLVNIPMSEIVRDCLEQKISANKKMLTNNDIAI
jgi:predicted DNA-binding protein